jgi:predicted kinase
VSGSGKTTIAARVVGQASAIRLRSDVERKRLAGMAATDRPATDDQTQSLYAPATTRRVYERLATLARTVLAAGTSVVVDAACNTRSQREVLAAVAREARVPLVWLDFEIPAEALLARVTARQAAGTDASDASADVVRTQLAAREPIAAEEASTVPGPPPVRIVRITPASFDDPALITRLVQEMGR